MHALRVSESGSTACVVVEVHGVCHGFEVTHEMTHIKANDSTRAATSVVKESVVCVILPRRSVSAEVLRAMYKSFDCTRPGILQSMQVCSSLGFPGSFWVAVPGVVSAPGAAAMSGLYIACFAESCCVVVCWLLCLGAIS